jgi:hypothetical protein
LGQRQIEEGEEERRRREEVGNQCKGKRSNTSANLEVDGA